MQHDHVLKYLIFDLLTTTPGSGGGGGSVGKYIYLPCCCIRHSLSFDMQHNHALKKLNFDLLIPSPRVVGGRGCLRPKYLQPCCCISWFPLIWYATRPCSEKSWILTYWPHPQGWGCGCGGIGLCWQNICYHYAAFVISFNLICSMTIFWKSWIFTFWPHPLGSWGERGLPEKYLLLCYCISWFPLIWYATWPCSEKLNFELLTPSPGLKWGVCGQNKCCHVAALVGLFNLICNVTMFWKGRILTF